MDGMIKRVAPFAVGAFALVATAVTAMPPASQCEIGPWARGKNYSVNIPATPRTNRQGHLEVDFPRYGRGEWDGELDSCLANSVCLVNIHLRGDVAC